MKEIIEKYKNGELTLYEFLGAGYTLERNVDQFRSCDGKVVVTSKGHIDNMIMPKDSERIVVKSTQLDKEIAAMAILKTDAELWKESQERELKEQPKQHKYEKVELNEIGEWVDGSWCYADNLHFEWSSSNIVPISEVSAIQLIQNPHKLVQKVELTQEDLEAQKVESLAEYMYNNGKVGKEAIGEFLKWSELDEGNDLIFWWREHARLALEWMELNK